MTDNKFLRGISNYIWGEDKDYKDNSYTRHMVHKAWHDIHSTEEDRKRSEQHRIQMERIRTEREEEILRKRN